MADKPTTGRLLGVPYNFERPGLRRILAAHVQPGKGMIVEKPFGIGYTVNLASWRTWVLLAVAGLLWYHERASKRSSEDALDSDDDSEVLID
ncbi:MAG: DUF5808 domain-containing protein [Halococcoides sp.]